MFQKRGDKETLAEEEARIKDEFKRAHAQGSEGSDGEDGGFLVTKPKILDDEESADGGKKASKKKQGREFNMPTDVDILNQLYGGDGLDRSEKFLRNYIFKEGWKDNLKNANWENEDHYQTYQEKREKLGDKVDKEDSERDLEMDLFEHNHNFRFEEKNAAYLTTHTRDAPEDSMRRVDDKRKQQRLTAQERKDQEKQKRKEEINQLKALKREEIMNKLKQTEFIAGYKGEHSLFQNKKMLEKAEKEL